MFSSLRYKADENPKIQYGDHYAHALFSDTADRSWSGPWALIVTQPRSRGLLRFQDGGRPVKSKGDSF